MDADVDETTPEEWTVDELARRADIPVRTIREYQTMGTLPPPRRSGRVGLYNRSHLRRLQLIARLQHRGYSLAGITDLLSSWRDGADLTEVLGLEPDQLVHFDEPGAPATLDQLAELIPSLVPDHLDGLLATGVVELCGPDRYCVPSPSLLQLTIEVLGAGLAPADALALMSAIGHAADGASDAVLAAFAKLPASSHNDTVAAVIKRGRGLLSHGVGRLTLHRIGRWIGAHEDTGASDIVDLVLDRRAAVKPRMRGRR